MRVVGVLALAATAGAVLFAFPVQQDLERFLLWVQSIGGWGPVVLAAAYTPAMRVERDSARRGSLTRSAWASDPADMPICPICRPACPVMTLHVPRAWNTIWAMATTSIVPQCFARFAIVGCLLLPLGCGGGAAPQPQAAGPSAVPRIAPPPRRTGPIEEPPPEPEPEKPKEPPKPERRIIGPWIEWQIADSPTIEGKGYLKLVVHAGYDSVLELTSYDAPNHETMPSVYFRARCRRRSR